MKGIGLAIVIGMFVGLGFFIWWGLGPVTYTDEAMVFVVPVVQQGFDVPIKLEEAHLIKHNEVFRLVLPFATGGKHVSPGGYRLNGSMNALQVLQKLRNTPDLVWITVPEGLRKEQVGTILASKLGWDNDKKSQWNSVYTLENKPEYAEGVYFPDTYLIPIDESVQQVADRFIGRFNEKFGPFLEQFTNKNIRWTTGLKIASLIQREAGGTHDMKLISGVIWNRLDNNMPLEIDATLQYLHGEINGNWWGKVDIADKKKDSPYNSYLHKGLPPTPIASPGLAAIEAALNPEVTECLFYLHDANRQIHCARIYQEHLKNIRQYLE